MTLTHHSQVTDDMIRPGNLAKTSAVAMAEVIGGEAFIWDKDGDWYAFDEEAERPEINWYHLSNDRYQKMLGFKRKGRS